MERVFQMYIFLYIVCFYISNLALIYNCKFSPLHRKYTFRVPPLSLKIHRYFFFTHIPYPSALPRSELTLPETCEQTDMPEMTRPKRMLTEGTKKRKTESNRARLRPNKSQSWDWPFYSGYKTDGKLDFMLLD